ncbi:hypothetical protein O6P43_021842 [Quillaja saponaria]|uniref:Uncharacterized protein n=1 Tax=Quillaja saponaria TaxID=32244 RepID=A0AAD7PGZ9_QUISA|nr:hypothetical protein O6P43_021842 [Quillaja saponaria]
MLRILKAIIGVEDDDRGQKMPKNFSSGAIKNTSTGTQTFKGTNNNTGMMSGDNNGRYGSKSDSDSG